MPQVASVTLRQYHLRASLCVQAPIFGVGTGLIDGSSAGNAIRCSEAKNAREHLPCDWHGQLAYSTASGRGVENATFWPMHAQAGKVARTSESVGTG